MATLTETQALSLRKYVAGQSIKDLSLLGFFYLKKSLVATFNEICALTTRTCLAEQGMIFSKLSETLELLW